MQQNQPKRDREPDFYNQTPKSGSVDTSPDTEEKRKVRITGVVTDCTKLNVRAEPDPNADVVAVIPALTEVVISIDASTSSFYKVCTAAGIEGFCMRKYIAVRK